MTVLNVHCARQKCISDESHFSVTYRKISYGKRKLIFICKPYSYSKALFLENSPLILGVTSFGLHFVKKIKSLENVSLI